MLSLRSLLLNSFLIPFFPPFFLLSLLSQFSFYFTIFTLILHFIPFLPTLHHRLPAIVSFFPFFFLSFSFLSNSPFYFSRSFLVILFSSISSTLFLLSILLISASFLPFSLVSNLIYLPFLPLGTSWEIHVVDWHSTSATLSNRRAPMHIKWWLWRGYLYEIPMSLQKRFCRTNLSGKYVREKEYNLGA